MTLVAISALALAACCAVVGTVALAGSSPPPREARIFGAGAFLAAVALALIAAWEIVA